MTKHVARLYALVVGVLAFFVAWVAVAAHPWAPAPAQDPRIAALAARQHLVQIESIRVKRIVDARWATYGRRLAVYNAAAAQRAAAQAQQATVQAQQVSAQSSVAAQPSVAYAQPSVRVVNLPALVVTRTS
jgi:hypothetical protein